MLNSYPATPGTDFVAIAIRPVRDGKPAPVTCADCGCRLVSTEAGFVHFDGGSGRDARGCRIACVDAVHALD